MSYNEICIGCPYSDKCEEPCDDYKDEEERYWERMDDIARGCK